MPVTKTAKRALRSSKRKESVNKITLSQLDASIRIAKKTKLDKDIKKAISLADRASKKKVLHANKSARIKRTLSKLAPAKATKKTPAKKAKKSPAKK